MELLPKDFEQLHSSKIREVIDDKAIVSSSYFFCDGLKLLFIKKSKKVFKLMGSASTLLPYQYRESTFEVLYVSECIDDVINKFRDCILTIYRPIKHQGELF